MIPKARVENAQEHQEGYQKGIALLIWDKLALDLAQLVKNLPAIQKTQVGFLDWEDSLEKRMATHSSLFAWRIPWTEESGGLQSMWSQRAVHNGTTNTPIHSPRLKTALIPSGKN